MPQLNVENIVFAYNKKEKIINDLSFHINENEFVFLLGANGSGKSTLLKLIANFLSPNAGKIFYQDTEIKLLHKPAAKIAYCAQQQALDNEMLVADIFEFMAYSFKLSKKEFSENCNQFISYFHLNEIWNKRIKNLSGGQKQLIHILLSLLQNPDLLLLDEVFVALDYNKQMQLISFLKQKKISTLCISHQWELAEMYADRVLVLDQGKLSLAASVKDIIDVHNYYIAEIIAKQSWQHVLNNDAIKTFVQENRLLICAKNNADAISIINEFLKAEKGTIISVKIFSENLAAAIIGKFGLWENRKKEEGNKRNKTNAGV